MSNLCTNCYDSGSYIDLCTGALVFGAAEASTDYTVVLKSLSTGKLQTFEATSDEDGYITVEEPALTSRTGYMIWATEGTANSAPVNLTIEGETFTCLTFHVVSTSLSPEEEYLTPEP